MDTWTRRIVVAATLTAGSTIGCTGKVEGPDRGSGQGPGDGPGLATGSGAGGGSTGAGPGVGSGAGPGAGDPTVCVPGVPRTSQLPRLTRTQYDNTIQELTGLATEPSTMLAPDTPGSVDQRAWDGYQAAADSLSAQIMADPAARARVIPCTPDADGSACARQMIVEFGQRAFRRPLTEAEIARFETLYASRATITATGSFDEAAQLIVRSFLLSPSFLTRAETAEAPDGEYFVLSGHEVASRLSYMLWGSMPDDSLSAAAAAGALSTPEGILLEAQRMLADPKARAMVSGFHQSYAHMGEGTRWADISRDATVYPAFNEAMVPAMSAETERFFDYVTFELGGTFQDLLTLPVAFVNADIAPLYGLDATAFGTELTRVDLDPATRSGVFTRAGFLASHSSFNRTSPILRGAFLQKEVLCTAIGTPPPDAEGTALPTEGLTTNRERVDAQTSAPACATCHHNYINPTGFAMETYDAIGAYQDMESGVAIDATADVLIGQTSVSVNGPVELMQAIANSPEAQTCYARRWVQYAYERSLTNEDSCTVENIAAKLTQGGYTIVNLIADLTQSQAFRYRALETEAAL